MPITVIGHISVEVFAVGGDDAQIQVVHQSLGRIRVSRGICPDEAGTKVSICRGVGFSCEAKVQVITIINDLPVDGVAREWAICKRKC